MQKSSSEALQKSTRKGVMLLTKLILVVLSDKSSYYSSFSRIIKKVGAPASCRSSCKATRTTVETGITTKKMQFKAFNAPAVMSLIKGMRTVGCFSLHYVVRLLQVQD